jgi:hypothetical protein
MRYILFGALAAAALVSILLADPTPNDGMSVALRDFLQKTIRLSDEELHSIGAGRALAKVLKTESKEEVAIFGIVKIQVPQEFFIEKVRNIIEFERGSNVHSAGLFHSPPLLSDVATLRMDDQDLKEIPKCKPGDCGIKLSDRAMQHLQKEIDWTSPQANIQAQSVIRKIFVDYVTAYQNIGDEALSVYYDKDKPQAIREGLHKLLQHSTGFFQYDPQLANYLEKYPHEKPRDTEDIFYWQKVEFGLKPVVRASHMVIHRISNENQITYSIASKMLFATHYFRAALELKSIVPDFTTEGGESMYLVVLNRSFVDGLTGLRGWLIGGRVKGGSRESVARYLTGAKQKLESAYRRR